MLSIRSPVLSVQAGRCLNQQLNKHRHAMESTDSASSALAEHAWNAHHAVDWDRMTILDHQPKVHQRLGWDWAPVT